MSGSDERQSDECPACGHERDDHWQESWWDEDGVEGMSCTECDCQWMTWDWSEVLSGEAWHDGTDNRPARPE